MLSLLAIAVIPCIYLMYKIYQADKIEKESRKLLVNILLLGAVATFGAMILETLGAIVLAFIGLNENSIFYALIFNFLVVAVSEEAVKRVAMKAPTWNNPEFNYRFDGVVYGVAATLGFAGLENIMYVFQYGFAVGVVRAVTSIPLHCICGVYMGYYYGWAKYHALHGNEALQNSCMRMSLLIPALIHGFYDFCASVNSDFLTIAFYVFIIVMDVMAIRSVRRFSREDAPMEDMPRKEVFYYRGDGPSEYIEADENGEKRS